jgi:hypothetical protein
MAQASIPISVSHEPWPRLVKVNGDLWVNPDHVVSVSPSTYRDASSVVIQTESRTFLVPGPMDDVVAAVQTGGRLT